MARFLNDFFVAVCGTDDRFVYALVCGAVVRFVVVFVFLVDNHSLIGVFCAVAHSGQKIDQKNDSRNYSAANNRLSELHFPCHECVDGSYDYRHRHENEQENAARPSVFLHSRLHLRIMDSV